jgi:Protein of unknown function (DUF1553)
MAPPDHHVVARLPPRFPRLARTSGSQSQDRFGQSFLLEISLRRLEAEAIRDSVLAVAGKLDGRLGGPSFKDQPDDPDYYRRGAYMARGYRSFAEVMPDFLQTFDAEDGRSVCSRRQETVTPPQALYFMNHALLESASEHLGQRLRSGSGNDLERMITLGFRWTLGRPPSPSERGLALDILQGNPARSRAFAWTLLNLDEFLYVR